MKTIICALLMLLGVGAYAQKNKTVLKDDLLKDKERLLTTYLPRAGGKYLYSLYTLSPAEFIERVHGYKMALNAQSDGQKDASLKDLMRKDADFTARNAINWYLEFYGLDSLGVKRFHDLLETKKYTDAEINAAQENAYVKRLNEKDKKYLGGLAWTGASLDDEVLFKRSAAYRQWLDNQLDRLVESRYKADSIQKYGGDQLLKIQILNKEISNPFIRTYLNYKACLAVIKTVKDERDKAETYNNFMALPGNGPYREEVRQVYDNYKRMAARGLAPDFNFADAEGKMVSLKSLRGKYVYIDVWATWCSPCKAEIPFLKKLEEELVDKNIHFVSLSVDKPTDHSKWVDYVKKNQLGGIQLISDKGFKADFITKFNINAIPRFILIDPQGKIISGDARRPSDPELKQELDVLLK